MNRGAWIIAGAILLAAVLIVGALFVLRDEPLRGRVTFGPGAGPISPSPASSPSPSALPSPSPSPTDPLTEARTVALSFHSAWEVNNRSAALAVGTRRAVKLLFSVPVEQRSDTQLETCLLNEKAFGPGVYQCPFIWTYRGVTYHPFSLLVTEGAGSYQVDSVVFHAD